MTGMSSKAADLKAAIDESLNQLAQAVDDQRASDEMRRYLDLMARFHRYSWGNCWLIATQRPGASFVAGFSRWKQLGRTVKKGEKAIRIMAPCPVRREDPETGDEEERVFFKTACVFDVSQTTGEELATYELPDVAVSADRLLRTLEQVAAKRGVVVHYATLREGHYGVSMGGEVQIALGYATGQQAKSLAHELSHERLHRAAEGQINAATTRETRELEAEAVAYVVCKHFSLDVELRASRYIAMWGGDAKALGASLSRISSTAKGLIEDAEAQQGGESQRAETTAVVPAHSEAA